MSVSQAVTERRSIRAFLDRPVEREVLQRVFETAQRAPSAGNVQPWHGIVLAGAVVERLKRHVFDAFSEGQSPTPRQHDEFPRALAQNFEARRFGVGEVMYETLGIAREDQAGRRRQMARNFLAFDAPVVLLVHAPRDIGPIQWSDVGMWLQTVLLLLREAGLDSCAQESWSIFHSQIRELVDYPEDHVLLYGVSIGWRDPAAPINAFPVPRAPLDEVIAWEGFGTQS